MKTKNLHIFTSQIEQAISLGPYFMYAAAYT